MIGTLLSMPPIGTVKQRKPLFNKYSKCELFSVFGQHGWGPVQANDLKSQQSSEFNNISLNYLWKLSPSNISDRT